MKARQTLLVSAVSVSVILLSSCAGWSKDRYYTDRTDTMRFHRSSSPEKKQQVGSFENLQRELSDLKTQRMQIDQRIADVQYQLLAMNPNYQKGWPVSLLSSSGENIPEKRTVGTKLFNESAPQKKVDIEDRLIDSRLDSINDTISRKPKKAIEFIEVSASSKPIAQTYQTSKPERNESESKVTAIPRNIIPVPKRTRYVVLFTFNDANSLKEFNHFLGEQGFKDKFAFNKNNDYRLYLGSFRRKQNASLRIEEIERLTGMTPELQLEKLDS